MSPLAGQIPVLHVAVGVLTNNHGQVLIAQRAPGSHMGGAWEFPGGKITPDETMLDGLVRELQEELAIRVQYVRYLLSFSHLYPDRMVHLHVWQVLSWEGEPEGAEGQPLRWVAVDKLLDQGLLPADEKIVTALQRNAEINQPEWQVFAEAIIGMTKSGMI
jgi:8-oxo-dGTP diphosphatase